MQRPMTSSGNSKWQTLELNQMSKFQIRINHQITKKVLIIREKEVRKINLINRLNQKKKLQKRRKSLHRRRKHLKKNKKKQLSQNPQNQQLHLKKIFWNKTKKSKFRKTEQKLQRLMILLKHKRNKLRNKLKKRNKKLKLLTHLISRHKWSLETNCQKCKLRLIRRKEPSRLKRKVRAPLFNQELLLNSLWLPRPKNHTVHKKVNLK